MAEDAPVETPVAEAAAPSHSEEGGVTKPGEWKATDNKIFKHWVRPRISQYRYLDDYRYNYYDDVLDYLDKRQKGISRDIPRPQYWAERVIRTNRKHSSSFVQNLLRLYH
ncbi:flightin-like isoform X2 [Culicoides brevitarsis]|uniref:flightin-like isoform X2 n=1 Tax=Culicoides brevitarsis TaxID=469753 RepID=UPI00307CB2FC